MKINNIKLGDRKQVDKNKYFFMNFCNYLRTKMKLFNQFSISQLTKSGFTLVEVLVSATLLFIIFVIIFSTLWSGLRGRRESREIAQRYMGARTVLDTMAKDIRSAFNFRYSKYENFKWEPEVPDSDQIIKRLSFWTVACDGMALELPCTAPIERTIYYVKQEEKDGKKRKVIYRKLDPVSPTENARVIEGPMIEGDFDLEVVYPPGNDPQALPIRVTIYFIIEKQRKELVKNVYLTQYKKR